MATNPPDGEDNSHRQKPDLLLSRRSLGPLAAMAALGHDTVLGSGRPESRPPLIQYPTSIPMFLESVPFEDTVVRTAGLLKTVNCQELLDQERRVRGDNSWEVLSLVRNLDETYSWEAQAFSKAFLSVKTGASVPATGTSGDVICESGASAGTRFKVRFLGGSLPYDVVSVESNAAAGMYLRLAGDAAASYQDQGFGAVRCQFDLDETGRFRTAGILRPAIETVLGWNSGPNAPTSAQCDALVQAMIGQLAPAGGVTGAGAVNPLKSSVDARFRRQASGLTGLQTAVVVFVADFLVFLTGLTGMTVRKSVSLNRAIAEFAETTWTPADWTTIEGLIKGIAGLDPSGKFDTSTTAVAARGANAFRLVDTFVTANFCRAVVPSLVVNLPQQTAFVAAVSLTAHTAAWKYTNKKSESSVFKQQCRQGLTVDSVVVTSATAVVRLMP